MEHPDQLIETNSMFAMFKCSICKLLMENPKSLRRCGHTFCFGCINQSLAILRRCPECRKDVNEIDVTPTIICVVWSRACNESVNCMNWGVNGQQLLQKLTQ